MSNPTWNNNSWKFSGCTQLSAKLTSRLKHLLIRISLGKETRAGSCKAFVGGRDRVKLCVGPGKLMGDPCA